MTPDTVRWAYLLLLGREPESPEVVESWRNAGLAALREGILASPEFQARMVSGRLDSPVAAPVGPAALETAIALRDGAFPAAAPPGREVPELDRLRREVLSAPDLQALLPPRDGLRLRRLRLPGRDMALFGDTRDPEFAGAPGPAAPLAAAVRALLPGGGEGVTAMVSGAGIGLAALAIHAAAPRLAGLRLWEGRLREAAFLAANIAENGVRAQVEAREAPPARDMLRQGAGLLRLAAPGAAAEALEAAGDVPVLLRLDLRALVLEGGHPREAIAALAAAFPGAAWLADAVTARPLDGPGQAALLEAALDGPQELVLAAAADWLERFAPA
ncbi:hypothetical protein ACI6QG_17725 [Roseococcus sp. DSY-14]|uniref:hypothetical protein n=1 Tax=Roseococcus sp. DSY-14 TaxID=3369650 RepID=UPI00387A85F0